MCEPYNAEYQLYSMYSEANNCYDSIFFCYISVLNRLVWHLKNGIFYTWLRFMLMHADVFFPYAD